MLIRKFGRGDDPLARHPAPQEAHTLADPALSVLLAGRTLGTWALGSEAIEVVAEAYRERKPALAIEFGSGASTLVLADLASTLSAEGSAAVISVEQDREQASQTISALQAAGLGEFVRVVHAPLSLSVVGGIPYSSYVLPVDFGDLVGNRLAAFVLVDGPAAESGARFATVLAIQPWLAPGALILLDDALRDGELDTARRWDGSGWIHVHGILARDKGILVAEVRP